jgi:tetratricopeptide (TPR) repeat protein
MALRFHKAFSSEVDAGSRQENASNKKYRNCRIVILLAAMATLVIALAPIPALAQDPGAPPPKQQKKLPEPPSKLPKVGADRTRGLDFLFGALKVAPDEASAKHVEARIWALWLQTPSDTTALLMMRAKAAMDAQQMDVALKLLDAVIKLRPDYVEGWNRRATLYYLQNDYAHSLEDIEQVLVREPRHFGALAGLGMIMQDLGDEKRALDAFRKALALNPHLDKVPELVKTLTEKVEGRDI